MKTYHEQNPVPTRSSYYDAVKRFCETHKDYSDTLSKITNAYQVDELGKALENATNAWDRGQEAQNFDSEIECLAGYFEGAWAETFGYWL